MPWTEDVGPGVHLFSPGLLQLTFQAAYPTDWSDWCVGRSTVWPHHAGATPAALASGSEAGGLQDSHLGLYRSLSDSGLPGRSLSAVVWRRSSSAAFCRLEDLCRQADLQQLWDRCFASAVQGCGTALSIAGLRQTDIGYEPFKRLLKT